MKTLKKISLILALSCSAGLFSGCADYLNVSDDLAAELTMQEVFENTSYTRRFHKYIYTGIPDISNIICNTSGDGAKTGLANPWPSLSDELKCAQFNTRDYPKNGYHAGNAPFSRWMLYKQIRQANQFLEYAHEITSTGNLDYIGTEELASLKAEARFLRAYYHFLLFELYGPIPIMNTISSASASDLDFYRNSIDEVVEFIDTEMNACYNQLPDKEATKERAGAPTKGVVLAVLAKLHIYAASPLFNGGYSEAIALRDNQGKQLFPAKDDKKWEKALNALQRLIDYTKGRYSLFKSTVNGKFDPEESLYQLFQECEKNSEVLWFTSQNTWGQIGGGDGRERRATPRAISMGMGCIGVLQEAIDDFFMKDGKSIQESDLYTEEGIGANQVPNMYLNREPRFYQSIIYAGRPWQIVGTKIYYHKGTGDDNSSANQTYSGYGLYKGMNRELHNSGNNKKSQYRAGIIFRLADFYLLYAEALNHINPADTRIVEYVDSVRARAGIPLLKDIKPEIIGNQALQEEAIRKERRVELFAEGQRYFDVRRWMCAEEEGYKQGGPAHGMDMNATTLEGFIANRVVFENRIFEKRMYFYPIPLAEIQKSKKLIQNPDW